MCRTAISPDKGWQCCYNLTVKLAPPHPKIVRLSRHFPNFRKSPDNLKNVKKKRGIPGFPPSKKVSVNKCPRFISQYSLIFSQKQKNVNFGDSIRIIEILQKKIVSVQKLYISMLLSNRKLPFLGPLRAPSNYFLIISQKRGSFGYVALLGLDLPQTSVRFSN